MTYFASKHFQLEELAAGVYAAIHREGGSAISNAGLIDLGDCTVIFDTFIAPAAAADLRDAAAALTGRPASVVINSHFHNDHIWGNQAFGPDVQIIATHETRRLIATEGVKEYKWSVENTPGQLQKLREKYEVETDAVRRSDLAYWINYYRTLETTLPYLKIRSPNLTFAERLAFHGPARSAELITYGGGHTPSDAFLYLPEEGVAFLGDLLFVGCHAYLADGDPWEKMRTLERISRLEMKTLVPGHGPVGTADDLERMKQYLVEMDRLARQVSRSGIPEKEWNDVRLPEPFGNWSSAHFVSINLRFLARRLLEEL